VWTALLGGLETVATEVQSAHIAAATLAAVQLVLLVLPYAGLTLITVNLGRRLCHAIRTRGSAPPDQPGTRIPFASSRGSTSCAK
jgi:hypothetical protein